MDRRVIGGGAIVCSAIALWSQPSAPGSQPIPDCDEGSTCTTTKARPAQPQPSILPPDLSRAIESLPIDWGGTREERLPDSMESMYADLLKQAQAAANESKLAIALTTVAGIPNNSKHHEQAKQLQESWAQELLERGNSHYQQGEVDAALSMLTAIPPTSDRFERAQELQARWNPQAALLDQAKDAKENGDWQTVMTAIESLEGTPLYDSRPVQQLLQQAIYRAYGSDAALMQLADLPVDTGAIAIPTDQAISTQQAAPNAALPNLPNLPIDVEQAMVWAQPSSPVAALPEPVPMSIAPSAPSPAAIAQQSVVSATVAPIAEVVSGSIALPESIATATIDKTSTRDRSRPSLSDQDASIDFKLIE